MVLPKTYELTNEQLGDKKISMAVMSSTVILTFQYLLLISFNLIDTATGALIQTTSKIMVALIFLYALPTVIKRCKRTFILIYYIAILIFLTHYVLFPENQIYMKSLIFPLFFICLPVFVYSFSLHDWKILKRVMKTASLVVFMIGLLLTFLILFGSASIGTYSMALSYYMLLPTVIFVDELMEQFTMKSFIFSISSLIIILAIGSRGAILCLLIFIVLKLLSPKFIEHFSKLKVFLYVVFIGLFSLIFTNLQNILMYLYRLLSQLGVNSRSIYLFISGEVDLSGRETIYQNILLEIANKPLLGLGLAGDRRVLDGTYAHNIFLEIIVNFGVLIGSILIFLLVISIILVLLKRDVIKYNLIIIWISLGFVSLFVSGSYLTDISFWTFLGLVVSQLKNDFTQHKKLLRNIGAKT